MKKRSRKPIQLTLESARKPTGHGGWRPRAGRPRGRSTVAHVARAPFAASSPQHVTLRVAEGIRNLRRGKTLRIAYAAIAASHKDVFRVIHFNLLSNHMHLIVEADGAVALARGVQGLAVRLARGFNRALDRSGKLFATRYHSRALKTPREVRNCLRYVLLNARKHAAEHQEKLTADWIDPYSSAVWFEGWKRAPFAREPWHKALLEVAVPIVPATAWLLTKGWQRWGPLGIDELN